MEIIRSICANVKKDKEKKPHVPDNCQGPASPSPGSEVCLPRLKGERGQAGFLVGGTVVLDGALARRMLYLE